MASSLLDMVIITLDIPGSPFPACCVFIASNFHDFGISSSETILSSIG